MRTERCGWIGAALMVALQASFGHASEPSDAVHRRFDDTRQPPTWRVIRSDEAAAHQFGQAIFNSIWLPAGAARAERRDGLGPVFNAASCDACHNNGARATAPRDDGRLPIGFVIQLGLANAVTTPLGDVLNPAAIEGFPAEGQVVLRYRMREVRFPDGAIVSLREPSYQLQGPRIAALPPQTVLKPRMASPLFGSGLLDAVPLSAFASDQDSSGRFGWQAGTRSVRDQTAKAFSREMGLHSADYPIDDCGDDTACVNAPEGGEPEVSEDFLQALTRFQSLLAVPQADALDGKAEAEGVRLFRRTGCAACHLPSLPVEGIDGIHQIAAYTDLRRHDLGDDLADRRIDGVVVESRWRTAPLWGIAHLPRGGQPGLMHDGRARSVEEAILWHAGEADAARAAFMDLSGTRRAQLLDWISRR
ncbi:MAG: di-heme oxidoredictase family protein [Lysobacteraceae bacterium]